MNLDRKTILALVLIGGVFFFTQSDLYKKTFFPKAYQQELLQKELQKHSETAENEIDSQPKPNAPQNVEIKQIENVVQTTTTPKSSVLTVNNNAEEEFITVETDIYKAVFSTRGAALVSMILKEYPGHDNKEYHMLPDEAQGTFGLTFFTPEQDSIDTRQWNFSTDAEHEIFVQNNEEKSITFTAVINGDNNRSIKKTFSFCPVPFEYFSFNLEP